MNGLSHWQRYTEELYNWIQRKYFELSKGKISKDRYYEYLAFYESEIQLVTLIIENDPTVHEFAEALNLIESEFYLKQNDDLNEFIETRFLNSVGETIPTQSKQAESKESAQARPSVAVQERIKQIQGTMNKRLQEKVNELKTRSEEVKINANKIEDMQAKLMVKKQFRLLFLGDPGTGKSSVRKIIEGKKFITQQLPVIGAVMSFKNIKINNENIKVFMIDIGRTENKASREGFYRNSDAILLFFKVNNEEQFLKLDSWINEIKINQAQPTPIYLIGTHKDQRHKIKKKRIENLISVIQKQGITPFPPRYFEVSIKDEKSIHKMIQSILQELYKKLV